MSKELRYLTVTLLKLVEEISEKMNEYESRTDPAYGVLEKTRHQLIRTIGDIHGIHYHDPIARKIYQLASDYTFEEFEISLGDCLENILKAVKGAETG